MLQVLDDDEFRFRTRDQHGRRDREGQRIKLLAADEIGDRRTLGPAANQLAKRGSRAIALTSSSKCV